MMSCRQVAREGTKKTVFTNFPELCRAMNRSQEHCMAFLLAVRAEMSSSLLDSLMLCTRLSHDI